MDRDVVEQIVRRALKGIKSVSDFLIEEPRVGSLILIYVRSDDDILKRLKAILDAMDKLSVAEPGIEFSFRIVRNADLSR